MVKKIEDESQKKIILTWPQGEKWEMWMPWMPWVRWVWAPDMMSILQQMFEANQAKTEATIKEWMDLMRKEIDAKLATGEIKSEKEFFSEMSPEELNALHDDIVSVIMYQVEENTSGNTYNEMFWWKRYEHIDKESAIKWWEEQYGLKNLLNRETMRGSWRLVERKMKMWTQDRQNLINKFNNNVVWTNTESQSIANEFSDGNLI